MKAIILILVLLISVRTLASNEKSSKIPFIYNKTYIINDKGKAISESDSEFSLLLHSQKKLRDKHNCDKSYTRQETESIDASILTELVQIIKNSLCAAIEDGEFKVWLKFDASGKVLGIGASSEGGIEATIKCSKK